VALRRLERRLPGTDVDGLVTDPSLERARLHGTAGHPSLRTSRLGGSRYRGQAVYLDSSIRPGLTLRLGAPRGPAALVPKVVQAGEVPRRDWPHNPRRDSGCLT